VGENTAVRVYNWLSRTRIKALLTTVRTDSEAVQESLKRIAGPNEP
jgi:hypothetical protein